MTLRRSARRRKTLMNSASTTSCKLVSQSAAFFHLWISVSRLHMGWSIVVELAHSGRRGSSYVETNTLASDVPNLSFILAHLFGSGTSNYVCMAFIVSRASFTAWVFENKILELRRCICNSGVYWLGIHRASVQANQRNSHGIKGSKLELNSAGICI